MTPGERLRVRRTRLQMSQETVAETAGLSTGCVSRVERGVRSPSARVLAALCRTLRMSADEVLFGDEHVGEYPAVVARFNDATIGHLAKLRDGGLHGLDLGEVVETLVYAELRRMLEPNQAGNSKGADNG